MNTNESDPKALKTIMEKENLNWRSFGTTEMFNARWNNPGTPTYYVLDSKGVIRYKWFGTPGAKAIDTALDKLIKEVEGKGKERPK